MKLLSSPDGIAEGIKQKLPGILANLAATVAEECGAKPEEATAVVLFHAETGSGKALMARVHRIDAFGDLGEALGTIDVAEAIGRVPNAAIMANLG